MNRQATLIAAIVTLGLGVNYGAFAQTDQPVAAANAESEAVRSATVLTLHGKIVEVNKAEKQVTLEGPNGRRVTLEVENPRNVEAAHVGD